MTVRHRRLAVLLVALVLAAPGCGSKNKVGDEKTLDFNEKEGNRVGDITTTTLPPATAATQAPTTKPAAATTAPRKTTTTPPTTAAPAAGAPVTISITSQRYEPFAFTVKVGTTLKVVNNDSQPRTFTADDGSFDSGPIAPGGAPFTYQAKTPGKFNFHDKTRPYVVGQMEVTA